MCLLCCMILPYFAYKLSSCYISFCHVHNFIFRDQITQSHFQSLRKPSPKLNSLEFAKALWEATELRLDTDPSHGQPMLRMHLALCKMAKSRGLFGFRWFKEQVELRNGRGWFLKPNEHCEIVGQCLAWFSLGCSSTIWTESSLEFWLMGSGTFSGKMSAESLWIWFFPAPWPGRDLTTALARWHTWSDIYTSGRMTYDFSGTISKTSCHMAIIEWRPQKVVERWPSEGQLGQKNASVSEDCGKKPSTELGSQPGDIQIATEYYWIYCKHLQTLLHSQKGRKKKNIILSSGSLNCLAGCRCWSFPRSLWDLAMAQIDWLNVTSCAPPGTAKTGTENGPQSGALLGAWLHVGPDTKSVT